jgi:GNAT superfamily N-acetyltransferase
MSIRIAKIEDAYQIATIHWLSWGNAYQNIIPPAYIAQITQQARLTHWQRQIIDRELDIYVKVVDSDRIVGWIATGPDREQPHDSSIAEIHALYIDPHYAGIGIGSELFDYVSDLFRAAGKSKIVLWVLEKNGPALGFYYKCGLSNVISSVKIERGGTELIEIKLEKLILKD